MTTWAPGDPLDGSPPDVRALAATPDGSVLFVASADGIVAYSASDFSSPLATTTDTDPAPAGTALACGQTSAGPMTLCVAKGGSTVDFYSLTGATFDTFDSVTVSGVILAMAAEVFEGDVLTLVVLTTGTTNVWMYDITASSAAPQVVLVLRGGVGIATGAGFAASSPASVLLGDFAPQPDPLPVPQPYPLQIAYNVGDQIVVVQVARVNATHDEFQSAYILTLGASAGDITSLSRAPADPAGGYDAIAIGQPVGTPDLLATSDAAGGAALHVEPIL